MDALPSHDMPPVDTPLGFEPADSAFLESLSSQDFDGTKSRGLTRGIVLWLAVLVSGSLLTGIYFGTVLRGSGDRADERTRAQSAIFQTRLLSDDIARGIDAIHSRVNLLAKGLSPTGEKPEADPILCWAEGEMLEGHATLHPWVRSSSPVAMNGESLPGVSATDNLLRQMESQIFYKNPAVIAWLRTEPSVLRDWLAVAFPAAGDSNRFLLVLFDPMKAFPLFSRLLEQAQEHGLRAFLVSSTGHVLAHSHPSYVGSNFAKIPVFEAAVRGMFNRGGSDGAGTFQSIDQVPVFASYSRVRALPLALVMEQTGVGGKTWTAKAFAISIQNNIRLVLGGLVLLLMMSLLFLWALKTNMRRRVEKAEQDALVHASSGPVPNVIAEMAIPTIQIEDSPLLNDDDVRNLSQSLSEKAEMQERIEVARNELMAHREIMRAFKEESTLLDRYEAEAARLRDPCALVSRLTAVASKLCASPALFFGYQSKDGSAVLVSEAGFSKGKGAASMSFPVSLGLIEEIQAMERLGKPTILPDYQPLSGVLLTMFGIAHFEAWAITGYGPLGRQTGRMRLLGILVFAQAGTTTISKRDSICRIIRSTGLVYENVILSCLPDERSGMMLPGM